MKKFDLPRRPRLRSPRPRRQQERPAVRVEATGTNVYVISERGTLTKYRLP